MIPELLFAFAKSVFNILEVMILKCKNIAEKIYNARE